METITHKHIEDACCALEGRQLDLARETLGRIASKWSGWILSELDAEGKPLRFSRLLERVEGITQKMLAQCLRQLEADGFLIRTLYPQVPPRVEYELTPLGRELLEQVRPLWFWLATNVDRLEDARKKASAQAVAVKSNGASDPAGAVVS